MVSFPCLVLFPYLCGCNAYEMILPTFTPEQIVAECKADLVDFFRYVDHKKVQLRKAALRAARFPVTLHGWHDTPRRNRWLYILQAMSKKDYDDTSVLTMVLTYRDERGRIWAVMPSYLSNGMLLTFYTPHFFARLAERLRLSETGYDLIYRYFRNNPNASYHYRDVPVDDEHYMRQVTATTQDGVSLGLVTTAGYLMKTFISYEMAKGDQIQRFADSEVLRKEREEAFAAENFRRR